MFSDILSAIAIVVAGGTFFWQYGLNRRLAAIEEERRGEEVSARLRADVTAFFEKTLSSKGTPRKIFVLKNRGPSMARGVRFTMRAVSGDAPLLVGVNPEEFALEFLDIEGRYEIPVEMMLSTGRAVDIYLQWEDEEGPQEKVLELSTTG